MSSRLPLCLFVALLAPGLATAQGSAPAPAPAAYEALWAYPVSKPPVPLAEIADANVPQRIPGSDAQYTKAQLRNLYVAPDWRPDVKAPMPAIVASGRKPDVFACGYCHLPTGTGRPENANLTGLSVGYIKQQMADFKSGARKTSVAAMLPQTMMARGAQNATDEEVDSAARYFAALPARSLVTVVEAEAVPRSAPQSWMLMPLPGNETESLGGRVVELPRDVFAVELRDPAVGFIAYVPKGSIARGATLASGTATRPGCGLCHGADLRGLGDVPRLAGRSPTDLARQLIDFRSGARRGALSAPMADMAKTLSDEEIVALVAYAASRP